MSNRAIPFLASLVLLLPACGGGGGGGGNTPGPNEEVQAFEFPAGLPDPTAVAVGDFDGDGLLDLAISSASGLEFEVRLGDGQGGFTVVPSQDLDQEGTRDIVAADFDGDGFLDLACANHADDNVTIYRGVGNGTFLSNGQTIVTSDGPTALAVGDLDLDGDADLVCANDGNDTVNVLLNVAGVLSSIGESTMDGTPTDLAVADVDDDGDLDVPVCVQDGTVVILVNSTNGTGGEVTITGLEVGGPVAIAAGDLDGDGDPDLAVCDGNVNGVVVLRNDAGTFVVLPVIPVGAFPQDVGIADADGDGDGDLHVTEGQGGTLSTLDVQGAPVRPVVALAPGAGRLTIGNLDGVGAPDVAVANPITGTVTAILMP